MNDLDLERQLQDHGTAWRAANHDRPGVDWDAVTTSPSSRRTWWAVAGTAVAAAAIIVPLVVAAGGTGTKALSPAAARKGAPKALVFVSGGRVTFQVLQGGDGVRPWHQKPVAAIGVGAGADEVTYAATPLSDCRTKVSQIMPNIHIKKSVPSFRVAPGRQYPTIAGGPAGSTRTTLAPAMAVSPDGSELAMVLVPPNPAHSTSKVHVTACNGAEEIAIMDLATGAVRYSHAQGADELVESLAWAPDSRRLAFVVVPNCDHTGADLSTCSGLGSLGTHVMDTTGQLRGLDRAPEVLPYRADINTDTAYDPNVFWWHGQLATIQGSLLSPIIKDGNLGRTLVKGFPVTVINVSSDPTGDHLILQVGPTVDNDTNGTIVATAATYRWDRGRLAEVYGGPYVGAPLGVSTGAASSTTDLYQPGW